MGADLSGVRFDARKDHSGVVLQQGRLLLDGDWNELVAILERRLRANVADLDGPGPQPGIQGTAAVSKVTPDAFALTLAAGDLAIGRGRLYADGLLAENHGGAPDDTFDPILAESFGSGAVTYSTQPYLPAPPALPKTGTHLVYLDVWQREVTHLEDPGLIERAVGVDTTARSQTVWQVKHFAVPAGTTCGTPDDALKGWGESIAPSGARLTVETIAVVDDEPCELPPTGGYRGLEHQTYRVEIHDPGTLGTATFKWSRDNASVASPILEVLDAGATVRPASLGKDDVLGFHDGDWVEILDDERELWGKPGEIRRIEIDDAEGTITLVGSALPVDLQLTIPDAASRHLRIRRWDQVGVVQNTAGGTVVDLDQAGATGVIPVPAVATDRVVLEHGLVVGFSSAGGSFRTGDHWIVPARAADASGGAVGADPLLEEAPPLGIHHHYVRLGILTAAGVTDCRPQWPTPGEGGGKGCDECGCECTECVTPVSHASGELTIQDAVDRVIASGGGTVCLAIGLYAIREPVRVADAVSVRIHGQGAGSIVVASASEGFVVSRSRFTTIDDLAIVAANDSAIVLDTTVAATVERVTALILAQEGPSRAAIALAGAAVLTRLRDNIVLAPTGIGEASTGAEARRRTLLVAALDVSDNFVVARDFGLRLDGTTAFMLANRVAANTVLRAAQGGLVTTGIVAPASLLPGSSVALDDNTVIVGGTGIAVSEGGFAITGNHVAAPRSDQPARTDGIAIMPTPRGELVRDTVRIDGNHIRGVGGHGIVDYSPVQTLEITRNRIEVTQHGIVVDEKSSVDVATIAHNTVLDVGSRITDEAPGVFGIRVVNATRAGIESNTVRGVGTAPTMGGRSIGIDVVAAAESRIAGNTVDRVGDVDNGRAEIGIAVRGFARSQIEGNSSRRYPPDPEFDPNGGGFIGLLVGSADEREHEVGFTTAGGITTGLSSSVFGIGPASAVGFGRISAPVVTVDANIVAGGAGDAPPAMIVGLRGDVIITSNHVHGNVEFGTLALWVRAETGAIAQNRLRGRREPTAELSLTGATVLGNLSSGILHLNGSPLGAPWDALNVAI
ncbi:DUF6519 domain-containing protein [Microbacterium sp. SS28]|uniref:DUF6519 domain-containing protein n=1 Tax=Microbacterium sp. SS28 TaxID=2919948 RepID=UPI001FAAF679|nr:DUF6519 domain-containing protein [Microbacterium sp. SS28]